MLLKIHSSPCFELKVFFPYLLCLFNLFKELFNKRDDKIKKLSEFCHLFNKNLSWNLLERSYNIFQIFYS
jgi:hypothetical protein